MQNRGEKKKVMLKKGITLVELVVVITIIAIITASSLISFSIIPSRRLKGDVRRIVSDLSWAREISIAGGYKKCTVDFDTDNNTYNIYKGDDSSGVLIKHQDLDVDLVSVIDSSGNTVPNITFNHPLGTAQDITITLSAGTKTRSVRVFGETGYVRME